jgi:hypothetical protein
MTAAHVIAGGVLFLAGGLLGALAIALPAGAGRRDDAMRHGRERQALTRLSLGAGVAPGVVAAVLDEVRETLPLAELAADADVTQVITEALR